MIIRGFFVSSICFFLATVSFAQIGDISKRLGMGNQSELSDSKVGSGLKEALQVGAENTVKLTGGVMAISEMRPSSSDAQKPADT